MKKSYLILILTIGLFCTEVYSQNIMYYSKIAEIQSKELLNVLDSVMEFEKKQGYFNDSTIFYIDISQDTTFIEIEIGTMDNCSFKNDDYSAIYKGHIFQINSMNKDLEGVLYTVSKYSLLFTVSRQELLRYGFKGDDDTRTIFIYEYRNGKFIKKETINN